MFSWFTSSSPSVTDAHILQPDKGNAPLRMALPSIFVYLLAPIPEEQEIIYEKESEIPLGTEVEPIQVHVRDKSLWGFLTFMVSGEDAETAPNTVTSGAGTIHPESQAGNQISAPLIPAGETERNLELPINSTMSTALPGGFGSQSQLSMESKACEVPHDSFDPVAGKQELDIQTDEQVIPNPLIERSEDAVVGVFLSSETNPLFSVKYGYLGSHANTEIMDSSVSTPLQEEDKLEAPEEMHESFWSGMALFGRNLTQEMKLQEVGDRKEISWSGFVEAEGDVAMPLRLNQQPHPPYDSDDSVITLGVERGYTSDEGMNHNESLDVNGIRQSLPVSDMRPLDIPRESSGLKPDIPLEFPTASGGTCTSTINRSKTDLVEIDHSSSSCIVCGRRGLSVHMSKNRCVSV